MIDTVVNYIFFKCFGVVAYVSAITQFFAGVVLITVTSVLRAGETDKFSCTVGISSTTAYKTHVEKTCYSRYDQRYNPLFPLYGFVILSFGFPFVVCAIYSLCVITRVDEIEKTLGRSNHRSNEAEREETSNGFCVFYSYFIHLVARSLFGCLLAVLQQTVFYPSGYDFEFVCNLPTSDVLRAQRQSATNTSFGKSNSTSVACENSTAHEMSICCWAVLVLNIVFAFITFAEVIYLIWHWVPVLKCCSKISSSRGGKEFVRHYLIRKRYRRVPSHNNPDDIMDGTIPLNSTTEISFQAWLQSHKQQVLKRTPDICYALGIDLNDLNDLYVDLVLYNGRAQQEFSKDMKRLEIFDVYTKVPKSSIRLEKIESLFKHIIDDSQDNPPRTILVVGRPGIGKSVLAEKIIRDWANEIDPIYSGRMVFFFKFRWFNQLEYRQLSMETFLRYGAGQSDERRQGIYEEIRNDPKKAIFIFDGLDEFDGDLNNYLEEARAIPYEPSMCTSAMILFIKLVREGLLDGATILVTSRSTVDHFYAKLNFNRHVEIIGFTPENIQEYVGKFCDNIKRKDYEEKIWNHINSSSDLLSLCYIPVNCLIVCLTLSHCLDSKNDTASLPTTLTKLYDTAVGHLSKHHDRNLDVKTQKKLQKLAFEGIKTGKLDFRKERFDKKMKKSGLVNSSSNPYFPNETKYSFLHLTIQEFLAAKHLVKTRTMDEIGRFITRHVETPKWRLVFLFIAGLLRERIEMPGCGYNPCIAAFLNGSILDGECEIDIQKHTINLQVMKCLREIDEEKIVEDICKTNLNHVTKVSFRGYLINTLSTSDAAAVCYVCKHLNNLKDLTLENAVPDDKSCFDEIAQLLQNRCLQRLELVAETENKLAKRQLTDALMGSECTLNHPEHAKLRELTLSIELDDDCATSLCSFVQNGSLQKLDLSRNHLTQSGMSQLSKALRRCPELQYLNLSYNKILHESMAELYDAVIRAQCPLSSLILDHCSLTKDCVSYLCKILCAEHCKLHELSLVANAKGICDEGVRELCIDALTKKQCNLTSLSLNACSGITDNCIPLVCETLQDRNCKLTRLSLEYTTITDEGKKLLRAVQDTECCKARGLEIDIFDSNYHLDAVNVL
ncbi:NACHT, LRR and PYD domains-containing protein 3-like [Dendronephthya gigantea]|uniref:NACHT, LRR and PYD domains-containing protein 3-like n=1 Tax=Dendronephthya gigantea TaxID=151771 RepID=UPI00106A4800|nr:NACHT, LRR and PYD domains-containing protein 3-like [Dendronephthya gigantea]